MRKAKRRRVMGVSLIVVGLALYLLQRVRGVGEEAILLVLGAVFLAGYFYRRKYGLLIPAGVLLGLGAGSALEDTRFQFGNTSMLGLGLGFVAVYVIALIYERRSHWWPLVPGGALLLAALPNTGRFFREVLEHWPLILVVVGLIILLGAGRRRSSAAGSAEE